MQKYKPLDLMIIDKDERRVIEPKIQSSTALANWNRYRKKPPEAYWFVNIGESFAWTDLNDNDIKKLIEVYK